MKDRTLLFSVTKKDLRIDTFRAGGKGGQKQNKTESGVRITHIESGAVGESREHRTQIENRRAAFRRMAESQTFGLWLKKATSKALGTEQRIQQAVERSIRDENLLVEGKDDDGNWVPLNETVPENR